MFDFQNAFCRYAWKVQPNESKPINKRLNRMERHEEWFVSFLFCFITDCLVRNSFSRITNVKNVWKNRY